MGAAWLAEDVEVAGAVTVVEVGDVVVEVVDISSSISKTLKYYLRITLTLFPPVFVVIHHSYHIARFRGINLLTVGAFM